MRTLTLSTRPGFAFSDILRLGLVLRLVGRLGGFEEAPLLYLRRLGSESLEVKVGRGIMTTLQRLRGCVNGACLLGRRAKYA